MQIAHAYTNAQRKAYVRHALAKLEEIGGLPSRYERALASIWQDGIARFVPKGRDPLDWATEP